MVVQTRSRDSTGAVDRPSTPTKAQWLHQHTDVNCALEQLGDIAGLTFSHLRKWESPAKRAKTPSHEVKKHFSFLFFTNRDILEGQIRTFLEYLHVFESSDQKIDFLLTKLSSAASECVSTRHNKTPASRSMLALQTQQSQPPPSPTLSVKHRPDVSTQQLGDIELPALPFQPTMASKDTSFAMTVFSQAQPGSQDPPSPATTLNDSFHSMHDTQDYGSSFSASAMPNFYEKLAAAQLDGTCESATQETNYGSDPYWPALDSSAPHVDRQEIQSHSQTQEDIESVRPPIETATKYAQELAAKASTGEQLPLAQKPTATVDVSPTKPFVSENVSPHRPEVSPMKSGSEHHRVKAIATDGLTDVRLPKKFYKLPFVLRQECVRISRGCEIDLQILDARWKHPRNFKSLYALAKELCPRFHKPFETPNDDYSLCIRRKWTQAKDGPLFLTEPLPLQKPPLTAFQRKFGNDRFLFVEADPLSKSPKHLDLAGQGDYIQRHFLEMLAQEQQWLGRTWIQLHAQPKKSKKKAGDAESIKAGAMQYIFFALSGDNLPPLGLRDVVGFALPFIDENLDKPWCKMYARLDLKTSRTTPALKLSPSDIEFVDDSYATEDPPDTEFNDPLLEFEGANSEDVVISDEGSKRVVINDGCSEVHEWVLRKIAEALGTDHIPSAAQIRCAGSKGMIFRKQCESHLEAHDSDNPEFRPLGPLIQLIKSQSKVCLKSDDLDPGRYDPHSLTLEVVRASDSVRPSYLYSDFLPILEDRGVPAEAIKRYVEKQAEQDIKLTLDSLEDPSTLRLLLHQQNSIREDYRRDLGEIETLAGFELERTERAIHMLESGFEPTKYKPLETLARSIVDDSLQQRKRAYRIPVFQSTMALGIADPTGTLRPGEIHFVSSQRCKDPITGKLWPLHLSGEVLVSRNPSSRPSDIQKVRGVYRSELAHIVDVAVFSSRGPQALADKCSGGDYDGDTFWLCWEPCLVKGFKNAPAQKPAEPEAFGIEVDKSTLRDIMPDLSEESVRRFVQMGTANRLRPNLLGIVTKTLERVIYMEGLHSPKANALADLKDLLMDSDKNGRIFTNEAWSKVKQDWHIANLPEPAFAAKSNADDEDRLPAVPKPENILDNVHCIILPRVIERGRRQLDAKLTNAEWQDTDLWAFYEQTLNSAPSDSIIRAEFTSLDGKLKQLYATWLQHMDNHAEAKSTDKALKWKTARVACREIFDAIQPDNPNHDTVVEWLRPHGVDGLTRWQEYKASALAKLYYDRKVTMSIAGGELCTLKARATESVRIMGMSSYCAVGPRKRRRPRDVEEDELDEFEQDVSGHVGDGDVMEEESDGHGSRNPLR